MDIEKLVFVVSMFREHVSGSCDATNTEFGRSEMGARRFSLRFEMCHVDRVVADHLWVSEK